MSYAQSTINLIAIVKKIIIHMTAKNVSPK